MFTLANLFAFDGPTLAAAVRATFARRNTDLPPQEPIALRPEFAELRDKIAQWNSFVRRTRVADASLTLATVVGHLHQFLWPIVGGLTRARPEPKVWPAGGPWS